MVAGGKGGKAGRKPGSVLQAAALGQRLGVVICLGPPLPAASSGALESGRVSWPTVVPGPCSQPGFTEPAPLDAAGALLPHLCTLACAQVGCPGPAIGGVFLWHCPHGRPHWALPSRPGHSGARTFLNRTRHPSEEKGRSDRDHLACFPVRSLGGAGWSAGWGVAGGGGSSIRIMLVGGCSSAG